MLPPLRRVAGEENSNRNLRWIKPDAAPAHMIECWSAPFHGLCGRPPPPLFSRPSPVFCLQSAGCGQTEQCARVGTPEHILRISLVSWLNTGLFFSEQRLFIGAGQYAALVAAMGHRSRHTTRRHRHRGLVFFFFHQNLCKSPRFVAPRQQSVSTEKEK